MSEQRWVRYSPGQSIEPPPWQAVRRFDVIELAGAAVVVLLIVAVAFVLVREAASDRPDEGYPPLPFSGPVYEQAGG